MLAGVYEAFKRMSLTFVGEIWLSMIFEDEFDKSHKHPLAGRLGYLQ